MTTTHDARSARSLVLWTVLGVAAALSIAWTFPALYPNLPAERSVSRAEAELIALENLTLVAPLPESPLVVTTLTPSADLELRVRARQRDFPDEAEAIRESGLAHHQVHWTVRVYPPGALPRQQSHMAFIGLDGKLLGYVYQQKDPPSTTLSEGEAKAAALAWLRRLSVVTVGLEAPDVRVRQGDGKRRLAVHLRARERILGDDLAYGIMVPFVGNEPSGVLPYYDEPPEDWVPALLRQSVLSGTFHLVVFIPLLILASIPFLKLYHDGQLGVRRGVQLALLVMAAGVVATVALAVQGSEGWNISDLTRRQSVLLYGGFRYVFIVLPSAGLALVGWSAGEYFCRVKDHAERLASFDALARGRWGNATVARSALTGTSAGVVMSALVVGLTLFFERVTGIYQPLGGDFLPNSLGTFVGIFVLLCNALVDTLPAVLLAVLFGVCWPRQKTLGFAVGWLLLVVLTPQVYGLPVAWGYATWGIAALVPLLLFAREDLLAAVLAVFVSKVLTESTGALFGDDPATRWHACVALLIAAAPLIASLRHLGSGDRHAYSWDDVPAHVRRIAERERQRVELETASEIQSSILPELPPSLNGVEIAAIYLPATEVGGDFYDALALEDGRVAVAVGDVAGHGVSSGLVMSMAKSALAVQVTFDADVEKVLQTLNRTVYQGARRRLLTTLCYGVVDPKRGELTYASAGHIYPYRVTAGGDVEGLTTGSYPLGVRASIDVDVRHVPLGRGDALFLLSDGLVEAHPESSDEAFGFERLETSLAAHAGKPPAALRDGVLGDLERYLGRRPWEDDLTVVVLRMPEAA